MNRDITLETLQQAMDNKELVLFYQPKVSMTTGCICGAEALVRWQKPDGCLIPPFKFIALAEESDFIKKITLYVFERLISDLSIINSIDKDLIVSFNASGKDFHDNIFTNVVLNAINGKFVNPYNIEIEVTETVLMDDSCAKTCLTQLADRGISIAMDDFGTGHSGITTLSKWPFSTIKIDKSLIDDVMLSDKKHSIIQAMIRLAHQLNLTVVGEGIEDLETYHMLQNYGCKIVQGFLVGRPMSLKNFVHYYNTYENYPARPIGLLYMAQLDHVQWRKGIIDAAIFLMNSPEKRTLENIRSCPELDHTQCKLGKWYYNQLEQDENIDLYKIMDKPHRELHEIGAELLNKSMERCSWDEFSHLTDLLSTKSMEVLAALQKVENHLSMQELSGGHGLW